jgi:hypothetical protein
MIKQFYKNQLIYHLKPEKETAKTQKKTHQRFFKKLLFKKLK